MGNKGTPSNLGGSRKKFKPAKKESKIAKKEGRGFLFWFGITASVVTLAGGPLIYFGLCPKPSLDRDAFPDTSNPTTVQWNVTNNSPVFSMYNVEFVCTVDAEFKDGGIWTNNDLANYSTVSDLLAGNKRVENCLFRNIGADWDKLSFLKLKMDVRYHWFWLVQCHKIQNVVGYKQDNGTFIWNFV